MSRQYPSKKQLLQIVDAAQGWAKVIRSNWPISDATPAENPALFTFPETADTATEQKQLTRQLVDVLGATKALSELVANVEPADPLAGSSTALRRCFPAGSPTNKALCGWPIEVSGAVKVLKEVGEKVHYALHGPSWQPGMRPIPNATVQGVEWAAGVLRDAADDGKITGKRRGGVRKRKSITPSKLTPKQVEAMQSVGDCNGDIAEAARRLGKDPKTVRQHYEAAMTKMGKTIVKHATRQLPSDRRGQANIADGQDRRL